MAETMKFDLVCPERRVAQFDATSVKIPAMEGDLTAMADHVPLITTLKPGLVVVNGPDGHQEYVVSGGFAEIRRDAISVLAEDAHHRDEMTQEMMDRLVSRVRERIQADEKAADDQNAPAGDVAHLLASMVAMGDHIGLSVDQSPLGDPNKSA